MDKFQKSSLEAAKLWKKEWDKCEKEWDKYMNNQSAKADNGKPKLSLVPTEIINCIAKCREFGTAKYHNPDNWKDVEKERYIDAAYRHWIKYVEDNNSVDEESGLPHLWHCACNLAFLCEFDKVDREAKETRQAILNVESEEHKHRKNISAPPKVIKEAVKKTLIDEWRKQFENYKMPRCEKCNGMTCKYYDLPTKSCMLFPNEHKGCEKK